MFRLFSIVTLLFYVPAYAQVPLPDYKGVFDRPPQHTPTANTPDGAIAGNGDVGIVYSGPPDHQRLYLSKNDCWIAKRGYPDGGLFLPGGLDIDVDTLAGAAYHAEQAISTGTISAVFGKGELVYHLKAWVAATANVVIVELWANRPGCVVRLGSWPKSGDGSRVDSGRADGVFWVGRHFDGADLEWPTDAIAAMKLVGAKGSSFELIPGVPVQIAVSLVTNHDTAGYLGRSIGLVKGLRATDIEALRRRHEQWWAAFWNASSVHLGDTLLEKYYYGSQYLLACCSRNNRYPPGLWGNAITGDSTDWEGDYHLNYNYQAPWWGVYSSNHVSLSDGYETPLLEYMPRARVHASTLLHCRGVYYPVGIGPAGFCSSVYPWTDSLSMARFHTKRITIDSGYMFLGQKSDAVFCTANMFMRFYSTYDLAYARKIYPFLLDVAAFWGDYLKVENGRYLSYNDNFSEVGPWEGKDWEKEFGDQDPTITLGLLRMFYKGLDDVSVFLHRDADKRAHWKFILDHLSPIPTVEVNGETRIRAVDGGTGSGASQTPGMGRVMMQGLIFPSGITGTKSTPEFAALLRKEIGRWGNEPGSDATWDDLGNGLETYFTAAARVGYDADSILAKLDWRIRKTGMSNLWISQGGGGTECFSAVPSCVDEMLLQSFEGQLRVFPDWPAGRDASFTHLRAYGAFLVSAEKKAGSVLFVDIVSEKGRPCVVENPWKGKRVGLHSTNGYELIRSGDSLRFSTRPGERFRLTPLPEPRSAAARADRTGDL